jgi:Glyoxalase-like domain
MDIRIQCLSIDSADPARIATFWEQALGWRRRWSEDDEVCLKPPEGSPANAAPPDLLFLRLPDTTTTGFP